MEKFVYESDQTTSQRLKSIYPFPQYLYRKYRQASYESFLLQSYHMQNMWSYILLVPLEACHK